MRIVSIALSLFLVSTAHTNLFAQAPQSTTATKQNALAVQTLQSALATMGGSSAVASITDFKAQGQITFNWTDEPVVCPVTVYGKGLSEFRYDATLAAGTRTFKLFGTSGMLQDGFGNTTALAFYTLFGSPHS